MIGRYNTVTHSDDDLRINKDVIECVETLKEKASGQCSELEIIEIPDNVKWEVSDYDEMETVHKKHRSW